MLDGRELGNCDGMGVGLVVFIMPATAGDKVGSLVGAHIGRADGMLKGCRDG